MRKVTGISTVSEGLSLRARVSVVIGDGYADGITQVYDNSTGSYSPDHASKPLVLDTEIVGYNPNTAKAISVGNKKVHWYMRDPYGSDTEITSTSTSSEAYVSGNRLFIKRNIPGTMSGVEVWANIYSFDDTNDASMTALRIDTPRIRLSTTVDVVTALSLAAENGSKTDYEYAGDGYAINPFQMPLMAEDSWKRRLRCQLYNGTTALTDAHEGTAKNGNGFYFWYVLDKSGNEILLTGDEDWFECEKYSDGTFAKECVVDLAKNNSMTVVCRAGYAAYGELSDVTEADGSINPSRLQFGYLRHRFSLAVRQPALTQIDVRSVSNDTLTRNQINTAQSTTHIIRQVLLTAGGMTVNELTNPVTGKKEYTDDGSTVQYFDEGKSLAYSDLVKRCYDITWYNDTTGAQIGTGEYLDKTLTELGATSADNIPQMSVEVTPKVADLFGYNYVVGYSPTSDDVVPLAGERHGNSDFLKQLEFMLFDTSTEDDSGTFQAYRLQRNNLFRYAGGGYAPTVGITDSQKAECADNALYSDPAGTTQVYAAGEYGDGTKEWEQHDKALMAAGGKPRTLYRKASDGTVSEVAHKLRPWETVRTDLSIGIGYTFPVYLLDQVKGDSGNIWKGIFTDVTEWDGIDLTPYKLEPTAFGPGAFTTIGGKARNFFYLYRPSDANSQGEAGNGGAISCFHEERAYPRSSDVTQITSMTYCRASNKDTTAPYPMAEGGYFTLDTMITAMELMAGTKCMHLPGFFGSGISSNDVPTADSFFRVGGVRYKTASATAYTYNTWGTSHKITVSGKETSTSWSDLSNYTMAKEQCMESQMAMSMAVELGIAPTTAGGSEKTFYMYGGKYYYMTVDGMTTPADGQMNARVYKVIDTSYTDDNDGSVEIQFRLRMSLYSGMMLAGDVLVYCGGGAELVAKASHTRDSDTYNNPVEFWLQPSQKDWKRITAVQVAADAEFGFEDSYIKLIKESDNVVTTANNWRKNRYSYTPFAVDSTTWTKGDCMYVWEDNWFDTSGSGKRTRLALRFGLHAHNGNCAARSMHCHNAVSYAYRLLAGRAQARVRLVQ